VLILDDGIIIMIMVSLKMMRKNVTKLDTMPSFYQELSSTPLLSYSLKQQQKVYILFMIILRCVQVCTSLLNSAILDTPVLARAYSFPVWFGA
jgi:hypothetical protein